MSTPVRNDACGRAGYGRLDRCYGGRSRAGAETAVGTRCVTIVVNCGDIDPAILGVSRHTDRLTKHGGGWRIQRRELTVEYGMVVLAMQLGFGSNK